MARTSLALTPNHWWAYETNANQTRFANGIAFNV
jgi:hypothetical protein